MTTTPPSEPTQPKKPDKPKKPSTTPKPFARTDQKDAALLKSPFAKMFQAAGATPTAKQIQGIINGILRNIINQMKRAAAEQKKADEHLKRVIKGEE